MIVIIAINAMDNSFQLHGRVHYMPLLVKNAKGSNNNGNHHDNNDSRNNGNSNVYPFYLNPIPWLSDSSRLDKSRTNPIPLRRFFRVRFQPRG